MPPVSAPSPSSGALYERGMQERREREWEREREYVHGDYESGRGTIETNVDDGVHRCGGERVWVRCGG